jgi:hypothetical protein
MTALDPALLAVLVVAGIGIILWTVLFVGSRLIAISMNRSARSEAPPCQSRFLRDLKPLEDLLVEFVAQTHEFSTVLAVLAAHDKPVSLATIVHEIRIDQKSSTRADTAATSVGIALLVLHMAGLAKLKGGRFVATEIGREVRQRTLRLAPPPVARPWRPAMAQTKISPVANGSKAGLSVGRRPSDNHGISWRSSLRDVTLPRYKRPVANIGELRRLAVAHAAQANRIHQNTTVSTKETKR